MTLYDTFAPKLKSFGDISGLDEFVRLVIARSYAKGFEDGQKK